MSESNLPPMAVVAAETVGGSEQEYVVLKANHDLNTRFVMLSDTTYLDPNHISNKLRHVFWLPDLELVAGDHFVVWTGYGTSGFFTGQPAYLAPGRRWYHHYLNLGNSIWNDEKDRATLFFLQQWKTTLVHGRSVQRAA